MTDISPSLEPLMLLHDRYGGCYSTGEWLAVANADLCIEQIPRAAWLFENGPGGDDPTAAMFWWDSPDWIAAGATPDVAIANLIRQQCDPQA